MPRLLLDTASDAVVVGLADGLSLIGGVTETGVRAQETIALVDRLLAETGTTRSDLEDVVVGVGPGGFTGLRIGIATARGIAAALGIPLGGVSSLAAVAQPAAAASSGDVVWAGIDAKRGEVFAQAFRQVNGIAGFSLVAESELLVGQREELAREHAIADLVVGRPTPEGLMETALLAAVGDVHSVVPTYGREPDATPPAQAQPAVRS